MPISQMSQDTTKSGAVNRARCYKDGEGATKESSNEPKHRCMGALWDGDHWSCADRTRKAIYMLAFTFMRGCI
jgi:hypothetical protein